MDILTLSLATSNTLGKLGIETELVPKVILEETEFEFIYNEDAGGVWVEVGGADLTNAIGKAGTFTVLFDGIAYPCKVTVKNKVAIFGNIGLMGAEDGTGEPFFGMIPVTGIVYLVATTEGKHTVGIVSETEKEEKVNSPIEAKYLPGVCLPVVEISTVLIVNETVALTEEEGVMLDAAVAKTLPVAIRFKLKAAGSDDASAQSVAILCNLSSDFYGNGIAALVAQFINISAVFADTEHGWAAMFDIPNTTDGGTDG